MNDSSVRLGVLSDTHGDLAGTRRAIELFRNRGVSAVIHCGDIGGTAIVRAFQGLETHFIFGNMDGEDERLRLAAEETGNVVHGWFGSLELGGKKIFFLHGHHFQRLDRAIRCGDWNLVCFGHTHQATLEQYGETVVLNPGAFQRVATPRIAVVTLPELAVESIDVRRSAS